jgi:hypothetical protein
MRIVLILTLFVALNGCSESATSSVSAPITTKSNDAMSDDQLPAENRKPPDDEIAKTMEAWQVLKPQERFGSNSWTHGVSSNYGFSFEFPGDYSEMALRPDLEAGDLKLDMLIHCQKQGYKFEAGNKFSIFVFSHPPAKRPKNSAEALNALSEGMNVVTGPDPVKCGRYDGFEIAVSSAVSSAKIRVFLIGELLYQMMVETPNDHAKPPAENVERFFNSLVSHLDAK